MGDGSSDGLFAPPSSPRPRPAPAATPDAPHGPPPAGPATMPSGATPPGVVVTPAAPSPHDAAGAGTPVEAAGYYPQEPFYAPGWTAPVPPPAPPVLPVRAVPQRPRRRGVVLVPVLVVVVLALVTAGVVGVRYWSSTRPLGEVTAPTTASARQLEPGHCLATLPRDGEVGSVRVVPCDEPHEAEVLGTHRYEDDAWPGEDAVRREATDACEMDSAQLQAGARAVVWTPTEGSWSQGDRTALCLARSARPTTGSWTTGDAQG